MCVSVCMCLKLLLCVRLCMRACGWVCVCACACLCVCVCVYVYIYTHTHVCMHVYICRSGSINATRTHTYVRTHARTHTQVSYVMSHTPMSHFHIWMRHVAYECRMPPTPTSLACRLHPRMSHALHYTNQCRTTLHPPMSHAAYECRTPTSLACRLHQPLSHAANTNDSLARSLTNHSCYAHECVMSHMNESRHRTAAAPPCMSHAHIWLRHVTLMLKSCPTYEWVMSHISMSHVTHLNESCHTSEWTLMLKSMFLSHI